MEKVSTVFYHRMLNSFSFQTHLLGVKIAKLKVTSGWIYEEKYDDLNPAISTDFFIVDW